MTITPEFIEEQMSLLNLISPLPWNACSCGKCGMISAEHDLIATATMGDWGDDYPDIRRVGGSIGGQFETFMNQITYGNVPEEEGHANAKYIAEACNNYPLLLEELIHLRQEIKEMDEKISAYEADDPYLVIRNKPTEEE